MGQANSDSESAWSAWLDFRDNHHQNPFHPRVADFALFLDCLFRDGKEWSTITTACSAVSTAVFFISGYRLSTNPLISLVKKGIRSSRPPTVGYADTWDLAIVFRWIQSLGPNNRLPPFLLLAKLVILLKIDLMARGSDLARLFVSEVSILGDKLRCRFFMPKQWRAGGKYTSGKFTSWVYVYSYPSEPLICSVSTIKYYLYVVDPATVVSDIVMPNCSFSCLFTSVFKGSSTHNNKLVRGRFFSLSAARIANIVKFVFQHAGVPSRYKAHSTRHAASSAAEVSGCPLDRILAQTMIADEKTFARYYRRDIVGRKKTRRLRATSTLSSFLRSCL